MKNRAFKLLKHIALASLLAILMACGGGGSDNTAEPSDRDNSANPNPNPNPNPSNPATPGTPTIHHLGSYGFSDPNSDVVGVFSKDEDGTALVLMRLSNGSEYFSVISDGTFVLEAVQYAGGQLAQLVFDGHWFKFYDYTQTRVTVEYSSRSGDVVTEIISRQTGDLVELTSSKNTELTAFIAKPISANFNYAGAEPDYANMTVAEYVNHVTDDGLRWAADPSNTYLPLLIWRRAGESILNVWEKARRLVDYMGDDQSRLGAVVKNQLICDTEFTYECAMTVAAETPTLYHELDKLRLNDGPHPSFNVNSSGIKPHRGEWDPLIKNGQLATDFTMTDVPCFESVFADMNPECPQYIAPPSNPTDPVDPVGPGALVAIDMIFETPANTPLTHTLGASTAADYAQIVDTPTHGTVNLYNPISGAFVYTPNPGFVGTDSFTYVAVAGLKQSAKGTVTVTVTPPAGGNDEPTVISSSNLKGQAGTGRTFTFSVAPGAKKLEVVLTEELGGWQSADLFVRYGNAPILNGIYYHSLPSTWTWTADCGSVRGDRAAETCTFVNPKAGTWHILVYGKSTFHGVTLTTTIWK